MNRDIKSLISLMTLTEKAGICSGEDYWKLKSLERLGVPSVRVCDGTSGLRLQTDADDHLGVNASIQMVSFPSACATAASFDRKLLEELGQALGAECQAKEVAIILGPALNIKRSPLCGRNFEYFSEDPYLTGELAAAEIRGIQNKNIGACPKHFACNNQETWRMWSDSRVDERSLREIYLTGFETAVKSAEPWTLMSSYNRLNGTYTSEHSRLLTEILRVEWGFDGFVMSDWGAVSDRINAIKAGLDLEMPGCQGITDEQLVQAVKCGLLDEAILDTAVERILNIVFRYTDNRLSNEYDPESHHQLSVKIEQESAVLLKNENKILPLNKQLKVVFIGEYAEKPRIQGGEIGRASCRERV